MKVIDPADLTKVSFNATQRTTMCLPVAAKHAGTNETEALNRAVQIYTGIIAMPLWKAILVLVNERAAVRKFRSGKK